MPIVNARKATPTTQIPISVAMTSFNSVSYIREQVVSVLEQSTAPTEIVISDDGSTDGTISVLKECAQADDRIVLTRNSRKVGNTINQNFENAVRRCSGEWVAFCDHDDIWLPEKLGVLYSYRESAPLIYGRSELVDSCGRPMEISTEEYLGFSKYFSGRLSPYLFIRANTVSGHAMIAHRSLIDFALPFPETITYDQWLALVASLKGGILFVDQTVVLHRIHLNNSVHSLKARNRKQRRYTVSPKERFYETSRRRAEILSRLSAFETDMEAEDQAFLSGFLEHAYQVPEQYFDLKFFFKAFAMRRRLYPRKFTWRLFKECIGGRWYRR